jgi:D-beta-D-heptose 7-phosphate kinase/D-beta-D-heptose 1-phosphate adenosyltransferase
LKKNLRPIYEFPESPEILSFRGVSNNVVFTNGVFDIIHSGHIHLLSQASTLGDFLIVGINSDASVKRLKGNSRPVNNVYSRAKVLSSLIQVDAVVIFNEDTPLNLIKHINPQVLVKGGDYSVQEIVGFDFITRNGGNVITIPTLDGFSTTSIIEKSQSQ